MRRNKKEKKSKKINKKIVFGALAIFFICISFGVYYFLLIPQIHLKGDKNVVVAYSNEYSEKGYEASFLGSDITKDVVVKGEVDENKLGTYEITYEVDAGAFHRKVKRIVQVKDLEKPSLDINEEDIYLCPGDQVVPEKVVATDNYDGDLSEKIQHTISSDNDKITYSVQDSSGNITEVTKKILYQDILKVI